jgi:hypothetical protein
MNSVAPSLPEQGQLVSVRSRQWIVNNMRPSTLPAPGLKPTFHSPQHLLTLSSVEDNGLGEELQVIWEIEPGARVIEKVALPEPSDIEDDPPRLFAFEEPPLGLRAVRVVANDAGEEITFAKAKEIVAEAKKKRRPMQQKAVPADKLALRLVRALERYKQRWNPDDLSDLARHLREFAETLEKPECGG